MSRQAYYGQQAIGGTGGGYTPVSLDQEADTSGGPRYSVCRNFNIGPNFAVGRSKSDDYGTKGESLSRLQAGGTFARQQFPDDERRIGGADFFLRTLLR